MSEQLALMLASRGMEAVAEMRQRQALAGQNAAIARQHQIASEQLLHGYREEARRRRAQQRRAEGQARAGFGAAGIDSGGGSAAAVLRGLQRNADRDIAGIGHTHALGRARLDLAHDTQRRNLLEAAQQQQIGWFRR